REWILIGKRLPRLDSVMKTNGAAVFALDIRRPGMLTVAVRPPEAFGATVVSVDDSAARRIPGVVDVQRLATGVAVYATNTWAAFRGRDALDVAWDTSKAEARSTHQIFQEYRDRLAEPGLTAVARRDAAGAVASPG